MIKKIIDLLSKKLNKDNGNKGFTLIEILVAMAIFGFVVVAIMSFFISMTKANNVVSNSTSLQYEARRITSFIVERAMESEKLYKELPKGEAGRFSFMYNEKSGTGEVEKFDCFSLKDGKLYYEEKTSESEVIAANENLLGEFVKEMTVNKVAPMEDTIKIVISMEKGDETYTYTQQVKLRNYSE